MSANLQRPNGRAKPFLTDDRKVPWRGVPKAARLSEKGMGPGPSPFGVKLTELAAGCNPARDSLTVYVDLNHVLTGGKGEGAYEVAIP